jgi:hypothetical protein
MTSADEFNKKKFLSLNSFLKQRNLSIHIDNELDL